LILYHGSNIEIEQVDINKCRPYKDFGQGFYLTTIEEQASKMATRVTRIYGGSPCITRFEFDAQILDQDWLSVCQFEKPNKDWALFVINNRNRSFQNTKDVMCNQDLKYDIVHGPIANDDLALLFRQFSGGLIDVDILVKAMEYKQLTDQYSFHTNAALNHLKKVGVQHD
jgi:hypothetical protein